MSDLRTLMHEAAGASDHAVTDSIVDADLVRARRALRRRRASRLSAGSGLIAAAAVGALVLVGPGGSTSGPTGTTTSAAPATAVDLVAYTGTQPVGYTLDRVPVGWEVHHDDVGLLTLAPSGAVLAADSEDEPQLEGTIAVMTQSDTGVPTGVQLDDVEVGGEPAVIAHMQGSGDTRTLFEKQPSGVYLVIQVWDGLGWSNDQIADFASSVHITKDAAQSVG
ncbi:MAG: hypothetical protein ABW004_07505 [Aeromicrobium sp.]